MIKLCDSLNKLKGVLSELEYATVREDLELNYVLNVSIKKTEPLLRQIQFDDLFVVNGQKFVILKITETQSNLLVEAQHIKFISFNNVFNPDYNVADKFTGTVSQLVAELKELCFFDLQLEDLTSDKTVQTFNLMNYNSKKISELLIDLGYEFNFDNEKIQLVTSRGEHTHNIYHEQLKSWSVERSKYESYNYKFCYASVPRTNYDFEVPNSIITSDAVLVKRSNIKRIKMIDCTSKVNAKFDNLRIDTTASNQEDYRAVKNFLNTCNSWERIETEPTTTVTLDTQSVINHLQKCKLGDKINLYMPSEKITLRATGICYDCIKDVVSDVEIGATPNTIIKFI